MAPCPLAWRGEYAHLRIFLPQFSGEPGATPSLATSTMRNRALLCIIASVGISSLFERDPDSLPPPRGHRQPPTPGSFLDEPSANIGRHRNNRSSHLIC